MTPDNKTGEQEPGRELGPAGEIAIDRVAEATEGAEILERIAEGLEETPTGEAATITQAFEDGMAPVNRYYHEEVNR